MWRGLVAVSGFGILIAGLYGQKLALDGDGRFPAVCLVLICVSLGGIGRASEGRESTIPMKRLSNRGAVHRTLPTLSWRPNLTIQGGVPEGWLYVEALHDGSSTNWFIRQVMRLSAGG